MFKAVNSNLSAPTFLSAMTVAALAQDSSSTMLVGTDPTWDILSMADEASTLWTYDETIVVGNSETADMPRDMTGLSSDLTGTWEYIEMDNTSDLIEYLQFKIAWSIHILVISLRCVVDSWTKSTFTSKISLISPFNRPFSSSEITALAGENLLSSLSWMIPLQGTIIPRIRLGLDSHIFLYNASQDGIIRVTEVYDIKGGPHRTLTVGEWTRNSSFSVPEPNIYDRRKDLSGVTLINSVLPWEPVMIFEAGQNGIQKLDGFMYRLYIILQGVSRIFAVQQCLDRNIFTGVFFIQILGFETEWILPDDMLWGAQEDNGSWSGIMGELERLRYLAS